MKWNATHMRAVLFILILVSVGYWFLSDNRPDYNRASTLIVLRDSIDPLKIHFNQARGNVRFITLLSST